MARYCCRGRDGSNGRSVSAHRSRGTLATNRTIRVGNAVANQVRSALFCSGSAGSNIRHCLVNCGNAFGLGHGCSNRVVGDSSRDDWLSNFNGVALGSHKFGNNSGKRARKFNQRLCGFDLNDYLVYGNGVARFDLPRNDFRFGKAFANVWQIEICNLAH